MVAGAAETQAAGGLAYRPEIDGLRAVAVLSVVLYHFGLPGLRGGFVGVDVFFVISGYLIGAILWTEAGRTGRISLVRFYLRRFRRLAPAYFAMAAASALVAWAVLLPQEFRDYAKTLIAATVYLSNVQFYRDAGYFDSGAEEKPLLHTWSLAVEEQFYLVLPLVLWLVWRAGRGAALLVALAAVSFAACIWVTGRDHPAAFYLFPFRAWELLAGVLLAVRPLRLPGGAAASWLGAALVLGGVVFIAPGAGFPGWQALVPVAGTVLLLANGAQANPVNRVLSSGPMVGVGRMSYSFYLWHWPVMVLSLAWRDAWAGPGEAAGWLALAFVLSWLSWRYVETPVRMGAWVTPRRLVTGVVVASGAVLAFGAAVFLTDGLPGRIGPEARPHVLASEDFIQDWSRCRTDAAGPLAGLEVCPIGPVGAPRFLAWGDSHLRAMKEGLDLAAQEAGVPGLLVWRAGCPPLAGLAKWESAATRAQDAACTAATAQLLAALPALPDLARVLLVGRWSYYAEGAGTGRDAHNAIALTPLEGPGDDQAAVYARAVADTIARLHGMGREVLVLRQVPEVPDYQSRRVARLLFHGHLAPGPALEALTTVGAAPLAARNARAEAPFAAAGAAGLVRWLDSHPSLCNGVACSVMAGDRSLYFDNNHLTNHGARALRGLFAPLFAGLGGRV
ncbi:acyltransferase family protein [Ruixingdingia sedimenti]|uniref:Acyltransferase family protein n=1 Tax=Ruixingdingia sedimenti TaxID=3073604 RepID=A0ABU1F5K5_9RHOB|nr:acyltransferase family protein [Xinfangfangia sp. LG-4]MDR5652160.1 acyltransferase family protein [Xinfangfangia sp. LG-4]